MILSTNQAEILIADDRDTDIDLIKSSFKKLKITNKINVVKDGMQLMAYLKNESPYENCQRPGLILLDLNMPRKNGREALAEIKNDPNLRRIPVVIMTSSNAEEDIVKSYDLHANAYIQKPMGIQEFHRIITQLESFWLTIVTLPPR